jgi:hypothetical protein
MYEVMPTCALGGRPGPEGECLSASYEYMYHGSKGVNRGGCDRVRAVQSSKIVPFVEPFLGAHFSVSLWQQLLSAALA